MTQPNHSPSPPNRLSDWLAPINGAVVPLLKAGFGNPLFATPGMTVLEVAGRRTGNILTVPLTCYVAYPLMVIGTVRSNSQWIKNLQAADECRVWLWGRRWRAHKSFANDNVALLSLHRSA